MRLLALHMSFFYRPPPLTMKAVVIFVKRAEIDLLACWRDDVAHNLSDWLITRGATPPRHSRHASKPLIFTLQQLQAPFVDRSFGRHIIYCLCGAASRKHQ